MIVRNDLILGRVKIQWSPDGTKVGITNDSKTATIWDAIDGTMLLELVGHTKSVRNVKWNNDGTKLLTLSDDSTAIIWSAFDGSKLSVLESPKAKAELRIKNKKSSISIFKK